MVRHIVMGTLILLLVLTATINAGSGIVSLYSVNGKNVDSVKAGAPVRFLIKYTNNTGEKCDVSTGFRLTSPDGAVWDSTTIDSIGPITAGVSKLGSYFDIVFYLGTASGDGIPPDTIGFLGAGQPNKATRQLPATWDDSVFAITAWFHNYDATNKHICIDSSFYQPGGTWIWVGKSLVDYTPEFRGVSASQPHQDGFGYCFAIRDLVCCLPPVKHVPADFATIQAAINACVPGDTVLVAPGTYTENISFKGKAIVVMSSDGAQVTTIKPLNNSLPIVSMEQQEPKGTVLSGFTLTGGYINGAVFCNGGSPTITHNIITGNRGAASNTSAGITLRNTHGSFIYRNLFSYDTTSYGIAVHVGDDGNTNSDDTVCYNIIYNDFGVSEIRALGNVTGLKVYNNTIYSPTMQGVAVQANGEVDVRNNILSGLTQWGVYVNDFTSTVVCEYNCVFGTGGSFFNASTGAGNIVADPKFVNVATHTFSLMENSPCINAGDPAAKYNDPNGTRNDMGALPYIGSVVPTVDTLHVPSQYATIAGAVGAIANNGVILVSPGTYAGGFTITGKSVMLKSTGGPDSTVITADSTVDLITFIGPEASGSLVEGFTLKRGHIGIWCQSSGPTIRRNVLYDQRVTNWAAICLAGPGYPSASVGASPATIVNNTIMYSANGGISTFSTEAPIIHNNIIAYTNHYGLHRQNNSLPLTSDHNVVWNCPAIAFNWPDSAIMNVDPLLDNNFHLLANSPCIDAGNPLAIYNDPDGSRNDIGAIPFGQKSTGPIPTNQWIILYCDHAFLDSNVVGPGAVITARDPQGVLCGQMTVGSAGKFGPMLVYADDPYTVVDEGASVGDLIYFEINGSPVYPTTPVIWNENGALKQVCEFQSGVCLSIPLHPGWNLVSWNVAFDGSIETMLAGIKSAVDIVLGYDQGGLVYISSLPQFSTLTNVDHHHGYWIKANREATLTLCGPRIMCGDDIPINAGWNLTGYEPSASLPVATALQSIMSSVQVVLGYDQGGKVYVPGQSSFNTLTTLTPGFGYWIRSSASNLLQIAGCRAGTGARSTEPVASSTIPSLGTRFWMSVYGSGLTFDGEPIVDGATLQFATEGHIVVGSSIYRNGMLKFTPVYGSDDQDPASGEYPKEGDKIRVLVDGIMAAETVVWTGHGTMIQLSSLTTSGDLPRSYALDQNYPNPFNPQTTISFSLPKPGSVHLTIFNALGQEIRVLVDQDYAAGSYKVLWDGTDRSGKSVASGVYFYRLEASDYRSTKKMLLIK